MQRTGDEYFDSKKFRKMLSEYEKGLEGHSTVFFDPDDLAEIADYYQFVGEDYKADEAINTALSINPGAVFPLVFRAHQALSKNDIKNAKDFVSRIIDKSDPEYIYISAEIMLSEGKVKEADNYLRDYLNEQDEGDREDVIIDVTRTLVDFEEFDYAQKWLSLATDTEHEDYKELKARILFGKGKYEDSISIFRELIDRNPFSKRDWQGLASAQFMNEEFRESVESSEYAIAIDPDDAHSLMVKANGMFRLENFEEALEYYRRYCEKAPYDDYGEYSQGITLFCMDRLDEAIEHLNKALAIGSDNSPNKPCIYQELAFAYAGIGQYDKAIESILETQKYDCDHAEMKVIHGHILLMADKFREAETLFKQAINNSDDVRATIIRVIASLQENGYAEAGYNLFKQLESIFEDDLNSGYSYMALCSNDLKMPGEFLKYLELACKTNPREAKSVLGRFFPSDMTVDEYYQCARQIWGK